MNIKLRRSVFETNSSSVHTLSFRKTECVTGEVEVGESLVVGLGEYGWGYEELDSPLEKLDYLCLLSAELEGDLSLVDSMIMKVFGNSLWSKLELAEGDKRGYIDHQSKHDSIFNELLGLDSDSLKSFFFDPSNKIIITNDNN